MLKESLTVSALTKYIKLKFDKDRFLKDVPLKGEIAEINCRRGNYYLKIKDAYAIISGVIFAQYETDTIKELAKGSEIELVGDISVYEKTGAYQIYIREVNLAGQGDIYLAFEKLKKKLLDAGYFNLEHKKKLPLFPKKLALVTAPRSAALHDMLITIKNRYPLAEVAIFETAVQGEKAATEITKQLKLADTSGADIVILARGGGSYEDLQAFNDEQIALQIFNMQTPIVTGVGHEIDTTIVDLVADVRAATPTAAIECATPDKVELMQNIEHAKLRFQRQFMLRLQKEAKEIQYSMQRLTSKSPENLLKYEHARLLQSYKRIQSAYLYNQLIQKPQIKLDERKSKLVEYTLQKLMLAKEEVERKRAVLTALSPFDVLLRGYAIAQKEQHVITTIEQVETNDSIDILVSDGNILCKVLETTPKEYDS